MIHKRQISKHALPELTTLDVFDHLNHRTCHKLDTDPYHFVVDLMEVDLTHFLHHVFILKGNKAKACKKDTHTHTHSR